MSSEALAARAANSAGVSVGTSLALETIVPGWPVFDRDRVAPDFVGLSGYKRVWFNVRTLFRNLYNAIDSGARDSVQVTDVAEALAEEISAVHRAITDATAGGVQVKFYNINYERVKKIFPAADVRVPKTDKQIAQDKLMHKSIERCKEIIETNHKGWWVESGPRLDPGTYGETLMCSHIGLDLLNYPRFGRLTLLESHTGQIKERNLWYTKLLMGKNYPIIPFCEPMLQIFGDDHIFHPKNIAIKRAITLMAQQNHWSFTTSMSKLRSDVNKHPDKLFVKEIQKFFVSL